MKNPIGIIKRIAVLLILQILCGCIVIMFNHKNNNDMLKSNSEVKVEEVQNFQRTPIQDSPFVLIQNENKHFIVMGQHRLTPIFETQDEAIAYINTWEFKIAVVIATIEGYNNLNKNSK